MKNNTANENDKGRKFANYLSEKASDYFPHFAGQAIEVVLLSQRVRPASILYRYDIRAGDEHEFVLVKVPSNREAKPVATKQERPRLVPETDPDVKFLLEHTALSAIQQHFSQLGDERFGTIRIFDFLSDERAIVMEEVLHPSLRQLFLRSNRLRSLGSADNLDRAFWNAGAWLAAYHKLPKEEYVQTRHRQRTEFVDLVNQFSLFLGHHLNSAAFFTKVSALVGKYAVACLPEALPLGLGHGDYAMRNLLVGSSGDVTVFDTLAKWRTAVYEDIAYFLVGLKFGWLQVFSLGLAFSNETLRRYEQAFLTGYFGHKPIPYRAIRLYEIQALLDKWLSAVSLIERKSGGRARAIGAIKLALMARSFQRAISELLHEVEVREKLPSHTAESLERQFTTLR